MNILLTGAAGQLGCELLPLLSARGRVTATDRIKPDSLLENWIELDISNAGKLEVLLNRLQPALIVNTAAFTAVDQAETDPETAFEVNYVCNNDAGFGKNSLIIIRENLSVSP